MDYSYELISGMQGTIDSAGYPDWTANNTIALNIYGTSELISSGYVELNELCRP